MYGRYGLGGGVAVLIVVVLWFARGVFGVASFNAEKNRMSREAEQMAVQLVSTAPNYVQNQPYYDYLVHEYHADAFENAIHREYKGRKTTHIFDEAKYLQVLLDAMEHRATADGSSHVTKALDELEVELFSDEEDAPAAPPKKPFLKDPATAGK